MIVGGGGCGGGMNLSRNLVPCNTAVEKSPVATKSIFLELYCQGSGEAAGYYRTITGLASGLCSITR